ncbi:MAG TPA: ATP-binding protein [Sphingobium sp.]
MRHIVARLRPRTLASQLVAVAALLLLITQLISFALLVQENRRQWVTMTAAPAALRIIDMLENGETQRPEQNLGPGRARIEYSDRAPPAHGFPAEAVAARAREMFESAGIKPRRIVAYIDNAPMAAPRKARTADRRENDAKPRGRLRLGVEMADRRWIIATSRVRDGGAPIARLVIGQTLLIYAAVLLPLLWIARRLSAPLGALTTAARNYAPHAPHVPLEERGPADVRELTHAFNDVQTRIGAMLAEKDHMLGAIGHDLRTPLASLRVRVESVEDAEEREQMAATIEDMNQMLDDILALARASSDRQPAQRVDLTALAEAVTEDFEAMGHDSRFEESERAVVHVHAPAIKRAVRNLVDNAIKYGHAARVSVRTDGNHALLRVEDDGPGIAAERIPEMLEPFTRIEQSRNRETGGSGLGLALVRAVMRAEGGELSLYNRSDGGGLIAEIRIRLD